MFYRFNNRFALYHAIKYIVFIVQKKQFLQEISPYKMATLL